MSQKKKAAQEVATMEQPKESFQMMALTDILEDPNQPRHLFADDDVQELAQSIREHGILSPLMIRDDGTDIIEGTLENEHRRHVFRLVTGHRRKRAAELAGLKEVPVILRDLTNDQALEIQIIENLQRKDVNAMEEALAFVRLKERGYHPEEIGHRVGKNRAYVIQRMKLADLDKGFQEVLYADRMTISLALQICRFSPSIQDELWKEAKVPKEWQKSKKWSLNLQSYHLERKTRELVDATFDLADGDLYPDAGACTQCPHNSASNPSLFPDLNRKKICHQPSCFAIKEKKNYDKSIQKVMADPDVIFINANTYPGKQAKEKINAVKELGATLIEKPDDFDVIAPPNEIQPWEEYYEENMDEDAADAEEEKNNLESEYKQMVAEYDKDLQEYQQIIASGKTQRAFVVNGTWQAPEGTVVHIKLKKNAHIEATQEGGKVNAEILMIDAELQAIEDREKRNRELDREKIFKACFPALEEKIMEKTRAQTEGEYIALIMLCYNICGYKATDYLCEALGVNKMGYSNTMELFNALKVLMVSDRGHFAAITDRFIRLVLLGKMVTAKQEDYEQYSNTAAIWHIMEEWIEDIRDENIRIQQEKTVKRQAGMAKRMDALLAKKKQLLEATPTPPQKKQNKVQKRRQADAAGN